MPSNCGVGEDSWESIRKEIKPVSLKENQPWILTGRTDAEAEALVVWSPNANSWLRGKDLHAGKDRGQEEQRGSEDEMTGWHHRCNGHELRGMARGTGAWWPAVLGVTKSRAWLGNWTTTNGIKICFSHVFHHHRTLFLIGNIYTHTHTHTHTHTCTAVW